MIFLCVILKVHTFNMAQWLSWLERRPVTAEVESSSLFWVDCIERYNDNSISYGIIAQLGEHLPYKQGVIGSSPIGPIMDGFPSGQRGQTVNLLATLSVVRIHLHPFRKKNLPKRLHVSLKCAYNII